MAKKKSKSRSRTNMRVLGQRRGRPSKDKIGGAAPRAPRPPQPPRTGPRDFPQSEGIVVSIGPANKDAKYVRGWYTFPLTPESVGPQVAGLWTDSQIVEGGEFGTFAGPALDSWSFSGMLEPPRFYSGGTRPDELRNYPAAEWGGVDEAELRRFVMESTLPPVGGENSPGVPPLRIPGGGFNDLGVVMQDGAHAGPNTYMEPHSFKEMLERTVKSGEIIRLIVGDDFGWNGLVSLREFSWRYEDPDPDVLYFDLSARQHRPRRLLGVKNTKKPKQPVYVTHNGDTLQSIAIKEWADPTKWKMIHALNKATIADLWYYPKTGKLPASIGHKVKGREKGRKVGAKKLKKKVDYTDIGATTKFRAGVRLRVMKRERSQNKPGAIKKRAPAKKKKGSIRGRRG